MPAIEGQQLSFEDYIKRMKDEIARHMSASRKEKSGTTQEPSEIWHEVLQTHSYIHNLTAADLRLIRYHTSVLTGNNVYEYWHPYPPIPPEAFAAYMGYDFLTDGIPTEYHVSEPSMPFGPPFGVLHKGKLLNKDVVRFQHLVSALATTNIVSALGATIPTFCEIGAGYGGLALSIWKALKGRVRYFIVDFPEVFLFSGSYLGLNAPEASFAFSESSVSKQAEVTQADIEPGFYFVPTNSSLLKNRLQSLDVCCNMFSFQEMTPEQIRGYLRFFDESEAKFLLVDNFDCHPYNEALKASGLVVPWLVEEKFDLFPGYEAYGSMHGGKNVYYSKLFLGISRKNANLIERWKKTPPTLRKSYQGIHTTIEPN